MKRALAFYALFFFSSGMQSRGPDKNLFKRRSEAKCTTLYISVSPEIGILYCLEVRRRSFI